jgi:uncharacterized protein (TIGR03067 family)
MRRTTNIFSFVFIVVLLVAAGCSPKQKSDSATLQGTWKGQEKGIQTGANVEGPLLVISGTNLELRGANTNEWYKATFTLREDTNPKQLIAVVTDCPFPQYVGKTSQAIYRIENGTLTLAANEPGNPAVPANFDAPNARVILFKVK